MTIRRALARLSLLLAVAGISFNVLARTPNAIITAPPQDGPTQVEFSTDQVSKWTNLPMGTYRVPNSDVIISGHQKGGAAPFLLFGLIGTAVQNGINAQNGKDLCLAAAGGAQGRPAETAQADRSDAGRNHLASGHRDTGRHSTGRHSAGRCRR